MTAFEVLLNEGIGPRTLYHYTDYTSLENILDDKELLGFKYVGTKNGELQVAVVRPSMANKKNLEALGSETNGGVKIIIHADKMIGNNKARGIKLKTIAELPTIPMNRMKVEKYKYKDSKRVFQKAKETLKSHGYKFSKNSADYDDDADRAANLIADDFHFSDDKIKNIDIMKNMILSWLRMEQLAKKREGEERLTFKDNGRDSIPVNKEFMEIELTKIPKDNIISKDLKVLMKKNKDLFKINDVYKKVLKMKADY